MRKKYPNVASCWRKWGGRLEKLALVEISGETRQTKKVVILRELPPVMPVSPTTRRGSVPPIIAEKEAEDASSMPEEETVHDEPVDSPKTELVEEQIEV